MRVIIRSLSVFLSHPVPLNEHAGSVILILILIDDCLVRVEHGIRSLADGCDQIDHGAIGKFADLASICVEGLTGTVGELYNRNAGLLVGTLDSTIWEDALLLSGVREDTLKGAIRELNLFGAIREMFLYLVVGEPINLKAVGVCRLSCAGICIKVHKALTSSICCWECLFNVAV